MERLLGIALNLYWNRLKCTLKVNFINLPSKSQKTSVNDFTNLICSSLEMASKLCIFQSSQVGNKKILYAENNRVLN